MHSPSPGNGGWDRTGATALLVLLGAGAVATAVGAAQYPGGTWTDGTTVGHSFWGNFLCDIARDVAVNGRPNPGAAWGRMAEWAVVLALGLFFWVVRALIAPSWRHVVPVLGALTTLALALVPVTVGLAHTFALAAGAGPGFVAAALVVAGLRERPLLSVLGGVALLLAVLAFALYLVFREGPLPVSVPAMQRLTLLVTVAWMSACAAAVRRAQEGVPSGASATSSPRAT